jgi:prephenate dehydrogenase
MPHDIQFQHLTVIGLGLIGGSLAMAARERFPHLQIQGIDPRAEALQYALKHEIIHKASLTLSERWPEQWEEPHLVVIACHLSESLETLKALAPQVQGKNILVTDIGSCKRQIAALGKELLPAEFIAGHPMAGKEFSGIEHGTALLFAGKSYLLCPHTETDPQRLEQLKSFIQGIGGNPKLIDADRHDRYMAYVSHLPQIYAILLTNLLYRHEPGHLLTYHGGGLDDQLRLAASPYAMWGDIFQQNGDNLSQVLEELKALIDEVLPLLREPTLSDTVTETWQAWFQRSNEIQKQFQAMRGNR